MKKHPFLLIISTLIWMIFDMGEVITPKSFMDKIAVIDVEKI